MEHTTPKGLSLVFALREEAHRLSLPDLDEATDADLQRLLHVLPEDDHNDAEEQAKGAEYTKDQLLVAFIRHILNSERPDAS